MTPLEALSRATDKYLPENVLDDLRALGFVIVPVEADEATIERMAKALFWNSVYHGYDKETLKSEWFRTNSIHRANSRAAYAAITASPSDPAPSDPPAPQTANPGSR